MSNISNIYSNIGASFATYNNTLKNNSAKKEDVDKKSTFDAEKTEKANSKEVAGRSNISGRTIGDVKLSDKAAKYYDQLKSKFHNMEFVLVSSDEIENVKKNSAAYGKANKTVVLIDEAKIEKMAEDEKYRAQYEGLIEKSATALQEFAKSASAAGANLKGYGMQVNDNGTVSYFAVLEKSTKAQSERIAKQREEKKAQKKEAEKKEAKSKRQEQIENSHEKLKTDKTDKLPKFAKKNQIDDDDVILTSDSLEDLLRKVQDQTQTQMSDNVLTESEKSIGQSIDFSL